jgi:hypothetical protein
MPALVWLQRLFEAILLRDDQSSFVGGWSPKHKGRVARHSIGIEASLASGTRAGSGR